MVRHTALLYGMNFVLGSMITLVRNAQIASPEKAAMHVGKNV
jgi:hypothetical protein